jgi:hypothetical protein
MVIEHTFDHKPLPSGSDVCIHSHHPVLRTCQTDVAAVRAEPNDAAERVTELRRGEPFAVEDRDEEWLRIRTVYDYPGWVRERDVGGAGGDPVAEARGYLGTPYLWGGLRRILHATQREGVDGVLEEPEPETLRVARRGFVRLETVFQTQTELTTDARKRL